jgi:hypothetical protein
VEELLNKFLGLSSSSWVLVGLAMVLTRRKEVLADGGYPCGAKNPDQHYSEMVRAYEFTGSASITSNC